MEMERSLEADIRHTWKSGLKRTEQEVSMTNSSDGLHVSRVDAVRTYGAAIGIITIFTQRDFQFNINSALLLNS